MNKKVLRFVLIGLVTIIFIGAAGSVYYLKLMSAEKTKTTNGALATAEYYDGAVLTPVTVGMTTDTYIEIESGCNEGDTVVLPNVTNEKSSTATQTKTQNADIPAFGGMGGPPPN